jgi:hypothetical protein
LVSTSSARRGGHVARHPHRPRHDRGSADVTLERPDFFISEEVTTVFPENGCVMHVLAWNITQAQHEELQVVRDNIYHLCEYLNRRNIAHGLAHPLLSPNWRLDVDLFEKALLLFPTLEGVNGLVAPVPRVPADEKRRQSINGSQEETTRPR